jgi:hypothetical protein
MTTSTRSSLISCATLLGLLGCTPPTDDNPFNSGFNDQTGDGDGDPTTEGDPSGDGDGDGDAGDGDGDGDQTGDGDGDQTGDGDGEPNPTCDDGIQNQDETDVDCGGNSCAKCDDGQNCTEAKHCVSNMCVGQKCVSGCLGDVDCDYLNDDCHIGICNIGVCQQFVGNNGKDCSTGEACKTGGKCQAGACVEQDVNCSFYDSDCSFGSCDLETGECVFNTANEGMPCSDADGCAVAPFCTAGVCNDPDGGALFYEPFANNDAGWTLGTNWQIGPAAAGCGDPGSDHTPTADNGVAGVVLGGCAPTFNIHPYYCLTSPPIDSSALPTVWMTYYRDLYSDYTPYMKNTLEVFNGSTWVMLFETFGPPEVNDANWTYFAYDVSAHANADMRFRWCYNIQSGGVFDRGSWNVDDVTVSLTECNGAD